MMRAISLALLLGAGLAAQSVDQALDALARNDARAAEAALDALAKANPQDRDAALARAVYLFQLGKFLPARQALEPLVSDPRAELFLLLTRAATGECSPQLGQHFPSNADPRLRRLAGLAAVQCAPDATTASLLLDQLRGLYPADPDVLYLAARLHLRGWNEIIQQLYEKAPASYRVNQISAEIFEIQGNFAAAVTEYRKAIEKNPRAINLHYRLGRALLFESHEPASIEQARQEFERELEINPGDAVAEYQVAQILVAQQKPDAARPRLERALALRAEFPEAALALGRIHLQANETARALPLLETAARLAPASEPAHYHLMLAYRNAGRDADAQREKTLLEKLQQPPAGEFSEFLKRLGEKQPPR